jgi:hypothetical protein
MTNIGILEQKLRNMEKNSPCTSTFEAGVWPPGMWREKNMLDDVLRGMEKTNWNSTKAAEAIKRMEKK